MKKTLLTAILAIPVLFFSCTSSEIEEEAQETGALIGFQTHVSKNSRAVANFLTNTNLERFYVTASYTTSTNTADHVQVFNSEPVTKNGTEWTYAEANARYWIKGANYVFHAFSCNNTLPQSSTPAFDPQTGNLTINGFTCNDGHQHDLIAATATATGKESGNDKVAFDFKHMLSKLHFTFIPDFPEGYTVKVTDVKLRNMRDKGNLIATSSAITWNSVDRTKTENVQTGEATEIIVPMSGEALPEAGTATSDILVVPFAYTDNNARLVFTIEAFNKNGESVHKSTRRGSFKPTWDMGKAYNYNVKLTGTEAGLEKIEFTTAPGMNLDGWATGTDNSVTFTFGTETTNP